MAIKHWIACPTFLSMQAALNEPVINVKSPFTELNWLDIWCILPPLYVASHALSFTAITKPMLIIIIIRVYFMPGCLLVFPFGSTEQKKRKSLIWVRIRIHKCTLVVSFPCELQLRIRARILIVIINRNLCWFEPTTNIRKGVFILHNRISVWSWPSFGRICIAVISIPHSSDITFAPRERVCAFVLLHGLIER